MRIRLAIRALLFCCSLNLAAQAQPTIVFDDLLESLPISSHLEYAIDPTGVLRFKQIADGEVKFVPLPGREPNFGKSRAAVWIRFKVRNDSQRAIFLQLQRPMIHYLDVYFSTPGDKRVLHTGALRPWTSREVDSHIYYIRLLGPGEEGAFYIRMKSDLNLDVPLSLGTVESCLEIERRHNIQLLLVGALIALMIYNFFIWLLVREHAYLYYGLCLLFKAISLDMLFSGIGFQFLWPRYPVFNLALSSLIALSFVFTLLFASSLFKTRQQFPGWHKLFYIFYLFAGIIIITNLAGFYYEADILDHIFAITNTVFLILLGVAATRSQIKVGVYFVCALTFLMGTIVLHALYVEGLISSNPFSYHVALSGNVAEAVMFAFALAHMIKSLQQQQEKMRLAQLKLVEHHSLTLEWQVQQRTEEIAAQNEELVAQQEQIGFQNELLQEAKLGLEQEAATRMLELMNVNRELVRQNHQLEQFAFIIAHNLRAPVARIQGLGNILTLTKSEEEALFVNQRMRDSANELNTVLTDLARILDIRKGTNASYVVVDVMESVAKVNLILREEIRVSEAQVEMSAEGDTKIFTLQPYVDSILYNLISNAIKYRSAERRLIIKISIERKEGWLAIRVQDNGLGIDVQRHGNKLFGLYQRFHLHLEGKGMGLHLVKLQSEALGGNVSVESRDDGGSIFTVSLSAGASGQMTLAVPVNTTDGSA